MREEDKINKKRDDDQNFQTVIYNFKNRLISSVSRLVHPGELKIFVLVYLISAILMIPVINLYIDHRLSEQTAELHLNDQRDLMLQRERLLVNIYDMLRDSIRVQQRFESRVFDKQALAELSSAFTAIMKLNNYYDQVRLLNRHGVEQIRINNQENGVTRVDDHHLQNKSNRYYFKDARNYLKNSNGIYLSRIDYNRENGKLERPLKLTLRTITRLFRNHEYFLVFNINLSRLIKDVLLQYPDNHKKYFLVNNRTDQYISLPGGGSEKISEASPGFKKLFPELSKAIEKTEGGTGTFLNNKGFFAFSTISLKNNIDKLLPVKFKKTIAVDREFLIVKSITHDTPQLRPFSNFTEAGTYTLALSLLGVILYPVARLMRRYDESRSKLENAVTRLKQSNSQLRDFSHINSHDLRAPVASLSMLLDHIEANTTDEENKKLIKSTQETTGHILRTLDLISVGLKYRMGHKEMIEYIELTTAVPQTINLFKGMLAEIDAEVNTNFSQATSLWFSRPGFDSIMINLLSNCIRFRHSERRLRIRIFSYRQKGHVFLQVEDNGHGFNSQKYGEKIFRLYRTFHRHPDAKGVGLYMVKNLIESHNGTINIDSHPDTGTRVIIKLPENRDKLSHKVYNV